MNERLTRFLRAVESLAGQNRLALARATADRGPQTANYVAPSVSAVGSYGRQSARRPEVAAVIGQSLPERAVPEGLTNYPPAEKWDDWVEYDSRAWPQKVARRYMLVPTVCFNCESACGLLAYVDKETLQIQKFEGNPEHPGSRGRNCAKGPATHNQVYDPERILFPLKRVGRRGEGKWVRVTWDEALDDLAGRIRKAFQEERHNEVIYHVGRPGHDGLMEWVLFAW